MEMNNAPSGFPPNKADMVIQRLANASQVGLLMLAIFGYFYTVVPFYRLAALEEELAKQSSELEVARNDLEVNRNDLLVSIEKFETKKRTTELVYSLALACAIRPEYMKPPEYSQCLMDNGLKVNKERGLNMSESQIRSLTDAVAHSWQEHEFDKGIRADHRFGRLLTFGDKDYFESRFLSKGADQ